MVVWPTKKKKNDRSTFANFLAAYKLHPTPERLNVILALIQDIDMNNKKRVCKFPEDGIGIKSLYFSGMNLYFLLDSPKELPFKKTIRRYGAEDTELTVHSRRAFHLQIN